MSGPLAVDGNRAPMTWRHVGLAAGLFLMLALSTGLRTGYSYGPVLMLLVAATAWHVDWKAVQWQRTDGWVVACILLFMVTWASRSVLDQEPLSAFDRLSRFGFALLCLAALIRRPPPTGVVWWGAAIGASCAGLFAIWQVLGHDGERARGLMVIAIAFGNLALLLGLICAAGAIDMLRRKLAWRAIGLWAAAVLGACASLLSGSRGGWLVLPLACILVYMDADHERRLRVAFSILATVLVSGILVVMLAGEMVAGRLAAMWVETLAYFAHGRDDTSIGIRLTQWRTAWELSMQAPWFGWGQPGVERAWHDLAERGFLQPWIAMFGHVHNEYLDALVKRGIVGLLGLLALYGVHLVLAWRVWQSAKQPSHREQLDRRGVTLVYLLFSVSFPVFSITMVCMAHNSMTMFYAFGSLALYAITRPLLVARSNPT